jgi:predicted phage terminase large subunit-like protein
MAESAVEIETKYAGAAASNRSKMEILALSPEGRAELDQKFATGALDPIAVKYDWSLWARPNQLMPPGDWTLWIALAGRGWGKSRTGAEFTRVMKDRHGRGILVARTAADIRETMIEGESGILAMSPPWDRPIYNPSKRRLTWANGAVASLFSADEPEALRGPQCNWFWADELASWRYLEATWSNLMFGWRLEPDPRGFISTTPRPVKLLKELIERPDVVISRGSSYENAGNLARQYYDNVIAPYVGTRTGEQEIEGKLLMDVPGALWTAEMLNECLVEPEKMPQMQRIVVAIDPATTSTETSDLTGIVVVGLGVDGRGYVIEDASKQCSPLGWARRAIGRYMKHKADLIVAETNNGGDLVERNLRSVNRHIPYRKVTASRGKVKRAEPVANLFEQGKCSIPRAEGFGDLIDQLRMFTPDEAFLKSPDRADAMVWGFSELFKLEKKLRRARALFSA